MRVRFPAPTLLFLSFLAFFLGLGWTPITDADEAFYARASWEMVESGDWLTPRYNDEDRWQKPVLYYWLTAATYLVTGPTEWAARAWAALAGLGLVFLTWTIAGQLTRRADAAFLAGAIVATCFGCFALGRMALPDLPLAFLITASIWAALRATTAPPDDVPRSSAGVVPSSAAPRSPAPVATAAAAVRAQPAAAPVPVAGVTRRAGTMRWWALAGLTAGLGLLMKGPVALVLPAIVLLPIWWRERAAVSLDRRGVATAALIGVCVGVPWYAAMWGTHGADYLQSFFVGDNLERFATDRFNEPRAPWYYVPVLLGGLLPWSIFLLALPWRTAAAWWRGARRLAAFEWRLVLWTAMPLLFYTASFGKQPRYILPLLPPLAILLATALARRLDEAATGRAGVALSVATWGTAALFGLCALLLARAQPLFISAYPSATWLAVGALAALAVALGVIALSGAWWRLPGTQIAAAALLLLAVQFGALTGVRPAPVEEMADLVRAHRTADERIGTYGVFVRNLVFYTGARQVEITDDVGALDFLRSRDRVLLAVPADDLPRLESLADVPLHRLGAVRYLDTAGIRLGTLLWPKPAEEVREVVLVVNEQ